MYWFSLIQVHSQPTNSERQEDSQSTDLPSSCPVDLDVCNRDGPVKIHAPHFISMPDDLSRLDENILSHTQNSAGTGGVTSSLSQTIRTWSKIRPRSSTFDVTAAATLLDSKTFLKPGQEVTTDEHHFAHLKSAGLIPTIEATSSQGSPFHLLVSPHLPEATQPSAEKSPFHQLIATPTTPVDHTPDIAQITTGMEQVSPFLELAIEEKTDQPFGQSLQEDPHFIGDQVGGRYVDHSLVDVKSDCMNHTTKGICLENKDSIRNVSNEKVRCAKEFEDTCLSTDRHTNTSAANSCDLELLQSDEFEQTFDIVSQLIDDLSADEAVNVSSQYDDANLENHVSVESETTSSCPRQIVPGDSDEWFDDILMEVEHWLH